jgi:hypothetical protein
LTAFAFALVLGAAFLHAGWNLLAKRSGAAWRRPRWSSASRCLRSREESHGPGAHCYPRAHDRVAVDEGGIVMAVERSFDRLLRRRMEQTGEDHAAARAAVLASKTEDAAPVLPVSDGSVVRATGRGWEAWLDTLDAWGAGERTHPEIARWLEGEHDLAGWWAQTVTVGFERAHGGREVGERPGGFEASASKTVNVPAERLFDAFTDPDLRAGWLEGAVLRERIATRPRSARFDWGDDGTRIAVWITAKGSDKSSVTLNHERLADSEAVTRMKGYWRERLSALKAALER